MFVIVTGDESEIIIVSLVRNPAYANDRGIGFLKDSKRISIAISRAKHGVFFIGDLNLMKKDPVWFKLFRDFVPFYRPMFFTLFENERIFIQPPTKTKESTAHLATTIPPVIKDFSSEFYLINSQLTIE